jgi:hypothetical protein
MNHDQDKQIQEMHDYIETEKRLQAKEKVKSLLIAAVIIAIVYLVVGFWDYL